MHGPSASCFEDGLVALTFSAQVAAFRNKTHRQITAVVRQSAQDVIAACQTPQPSVKETGGSFEIGKIPVDLGNLRNNVVTEIVGGPSAQGGDAYAAVLAQAEAGDTIRHSYLSEYAPAIEYGTRHIAPRMFVRYNLERWQAFVAENLSRVAGRQ